MSDVGRQIDRYVIEAVLGAGGFGAVYRARHTVLGTQVALKVLNPQRAEDATTVERFLREAKMAAGIGSPHIVGVSDAGAEAGKPFLAMELLAGEDLEGRLARAGALPLSAAVDIGLQILEGLSAAHGAGIVHRDMKPANVFLVPGPDGRPFVKLLDFGISKVITPGGIAQLTQTGAMLGTPAYMAPEQMQNTSGVDARADLYSVAAMLFEMCTGRLPYRAETIGDMVLRLQGATAERLETHLPGAPRALADLIALNLSTVPEQRSPDARRFASELRALRASMPDAPVSVRLASPRQQADPFLSTRASTPGQARRPGPETPAFGGVSSLGVSAPPLTAPPLSAPPLSAPYAPYSPSVGQAHSMPGAPLSEVAPRDGSRVAWVVAAALLLFLPVACIGGGIATYLFSADEEPPPRQTWSSPVVIPSAPPPSAPPPIRPIAPPVAPPAPPPIGSGPIVATPLPEGTEPCAARVVHQVECDRSWDAHEPDTCTVQGGRELHVIGAYAGGEIGLDVARTAAPLVLVLSSYSAATWRLRVAEGVRIEEIVTVGMQTSEVLGAPEGTRVRSERSSMRGGYPIMGWSWEGMSESWSGARTARTAERDLNLSLRSYVGCYAPDYFVLAQAPP
ncbi:MAG: serine/threonine-protein kinase [Sandaracinaceae bacterium]